MTNARDGDDRSVSTAANESSSASADREAIAKDNSIAEAPVTPALPPKPPRNGPLPPRPAHIAQPLSTPGTTVPVSSTSTEQLRHQRGVPPLLAGIVTTLLILVAVVQTVSIARLTQRVDDQGKIAQQTEERLAEIEEQGKDLAARALRLEERTSGTLNSASVAKEALESVFRVQVGDEIGTAFAFGAKPKGAGTRLLTNYHVVQSAFQSDGKAVTVEHSDRRYNAQIEQADKDLDLAVLRIQASFPRLRPALVQVSPGDPVVVVGAPLGLSDTVTTGVVSAVDRRVEGLNSPLIQFDAAVSPGNSGGPVINANGEVVGIAQAKINVPEADGLALAIPVAVACQEIIRC